jgi:beta-lactam-binding protein with PASTA domain
LEAAGFQTQRQGVYSSRREGTFLGISPSETAVKFSTIRLKVSLGPKPEPKPKPKPQPEPEPTKEPEPPKETKPTKPAESKPPADGDGD